MVELVTRHVRTVVPELGELVFQVMVATAWPFVSGDNWRIITCGPGYNPEALAIIAGHRNKINVVI